MPALGYIGQDTIESAIQSLKDKGAQFMGAWNQLLSVEDRISVYPDLYDQWQSLKSKGDEIKSTISYIASAVDSVGGFLSKTFGLSGMGAMGIVPLIPIAVITGATAAIMWFISSVSDIIDALNRREMTDKGYSPEQIAAATAPTLSTNISRIVLYAGLAAFGIIVLPKLLKKG